MLLTELRGLQVEDFAIDSSTYAPAVSAVWLNLITDLSMFIVSQRLLCLDISLTAHVTHILSFGTSFKKEIVFPKSLNSLPHNPNF